MITWTVSKQFREHFLFQPVSNNWDLMERFESRCHLLIRSTSIHQVRCSWFWVCNILPCQWISSKDCHHWWSKCKSFDYGMFHLHLWHINPSIMAHVCWLHCSYNVICSVFFLMLWICTWIMFFKIICVFHSHYYFIIILSALILNNGRRPCAVEYKSKKSQSDQHPHKFGKPKF